MKIMCDTNVIIDVLLEREPFIEDSYKVLKLCEEHKIDGFVSASSVTNTTYFGNLQKFSDCLICHISAMGIFSYKIVDVTNNDILIAFQKRAKDFEDCLVATCAKSIHCDYIVTRNKRDFESFGIPALTPTEVLLNIM